MAFLVFFERLSVVSILFNDLHPSRRCTFDVTVKPGRVPPFTPLKKPQGSSWDQAWIKLSVERAQYKRLTTSNYQE